MRNQPSAPRKIDEILLSVANKPYAMDLFFLMRNLEANNNTTKLGYANKYRDETLQFGQEPSSIFASSSVAKLYQYTNGRKPKLAIHSFGLFGPNGPMPLVFTEYVKERIAHHGDYAASDFIDIFHNRLIMLFYRAWADSNSCASLDNSEESFTRYIISLCAAGYSPTQKKDSIPSHARWHNAGHLMQQTRSAEGLQNILAGFFKIQIRIEEFVSHWLLLPKEEQTSLGGTKGTQLGFDTVLGRKVLSKQQHFRIHLGPLTQEEYDQFLPNTDKYQQMRDWVLTYVGTEFTWDMCLILKNTTKNIGIALGKQKKLGWNSWLSADHSNSPQKQNNLISSVIFHPEKQIQFS